MDGCRGVPCAHGFDGFPRKDLVWGHETAPGGIGALLLIADHDTGRGYYPGYDGRGSVTLLVDAETGAKVAGMEYDIWGRLVRATGEWRVTPFLFDTKWSLDYRSRDIVTHWPTGLYDYGFRFYQPATGRFINRDPIREQGGLNLYQAFAGDPVNRTDFLGLFDEGWPGPILSGLTIGDCIQYGGTFNSGDGKCYFELGLMNDEFKKSLDGLGDHLGFQQPRGGQPNQSDPFDFGFEDRFEVDLTFTDRGSSLNIDGSTGWGNRGWEVDLTYTHQGSSPNTDGGGNIFGSNHSFCAYGASAGGLLWSGGALGSRVL